MNYTQCTDEREIAATIWNVLASFGYAETRAAQSGEKAPSSERIVIDGGKTYSMQLANKSARAMAELIAAAIECAEAIGFLDFYLEISCPSEVSELLYLYGLEDYIDDKEGDFEFWGRCGKRTVFCGGNRGDVISCEFNLRECADAENTIVCTPLPKTIIFPEKDAEGIAYDVSFTLRASGCLIIGYLGNGDIAECEEYAKLEDASGIIRVFADGKLQIKELSDGSITETDCDSFLGYLHDDDDDRTHDHDCDCGCCHD